MARFSISLRNYAGIPVVDLMGEVDSGMLTALADILGKLVDAGHYHAMVNLKRTTWLSVASLSALEELAKSFRTHYGTLDVIVSEEQNGLLKDSESFNLYHLLQFCVSEAQALMRIRKIPAPSVGIVQTTNARL